MCVVWMRPLFCWIPMNCLRSGLPYCESFSAARCACRRTHRTRPLRPTLEAVFYASNTQAEQRYGRLSCQQGPSRGILILENEVIKECVGVNDIRLRPGDSPQRRALPLARAAGRGGLQ